MLKVAHRGGKLPGIESEENCPSAFSLAIQSGADAIEFDVHLTKDKVPIVFHDYVLERLTDGMGKLSEFTLDELEDVCIKKTGEAIPTLLQVLALCKEKTLFIELKKNNPGIVEIVTPMLKDMRNIVIISFDLDYVAQAKLLGFQTCVLLEKNEMDKLPSVIDLKPDWIGLHWKVTTPELVSAMENIKLYVWTVNDCNELQYFKNLGVSAIASDHLDYF